MKRKHKVYSKPRKAYDKNRIEEEVKIFEEFGLKNKREIWKVESKVKLMKERAKNLITSPKEEQKTFFDGLKKLGLNVNSIEDVLSLDKKDYLKRRLQTIVHIKRIAKSSKEARQLITHKKIIVDRKVVDRPSYLVPVDIEEKIYLKQKSKNKPSESQEDLDN